MPLLLKRMDDTMNAKRKRRRQLRILIVVGITLLLAALLILLLAWMWRFVSDRLAHCRGEGVLLRGGRPSLYRISYHRRHGLSV